VRDERVGAGGAQSLEQRREIPRPVIDHRDPDPASSAA
jgi:hypothetical protein